MVKWLQSPRRVPGWRQDPAGHSPGDAVGEGELELAQAHKYCAAGDHCTGAEPVHQQPHGNLEPGVDKELKDGEEGDG